MTTLIKNVQLIDGTGSVPYKADVILKRKFISAIGYFPRYRAHTTIDGRGAYLAPGFIDIHSTLDRYLNIFTDKYSGNESAINILVQGVTTIIGGNDGISLAPLIYGSLESMREWTDTRRINLSWHSVEEFLKAIGRFPLAVNFGTMVGYKTICRSLMGNGIRMLTQNELGVLKHVLAKALREGAFGLSIGSDELRDSIPFQEMKSLLDILVKYRALYATELHGVKEEKISSLHRMIHMGEEIGIRTLINHLEPVKGFELEYGKILEIMNSTSARVDVFFDTYPSDSRVFRIGDLFPRWLSKIGGDNQDSETKTVLEKLIDKSTREKVIKELPVLRSNDVVIVSAPEHDYLEGKTLKEFSRNRGLTTFTGIVELFELTKGEAIISYKSVNPKRIVTGLTHGQSIIASSDAHLKETPRDTFPKFLALAEEEKALPIEIAVYKITGLPAKKLGLGNRGLIKIGYFADLAVFKGGDIRDVILNGEVVVRDAKFERNFAGQTLKHKP